jgi:uncharacterized membrane protein YsdA (DUF1294 family)
MILLLYSAILYYAVVSGVTFLVYAMDKSAAQRESRRRVPEQTLHCLALIGGWPGAWAAQRWLRHKSRKRSFQLAFWLTVVANLAVLAWVLWLYWSFAATPSSAT